MTIEDRLSSLGLTLPVTNAASGNYSHAVEDGHLLYLAGKGPSDISGKVGKDFSKDEAYKISKKIGLQLLAVAKDYLGTLDRIDRIIKVTGFVNAVDDFQDHPEVINGCSDLFVTLFGERGLHARSAVGVASLPYQIPVEIEAVIRFTS